MPVPKPDSIEYLSVVSPNKDLVYKIIGYSPVAFDNLYGIGAREGIINQSRVNFIYQYSRSTLDTLIDVVNDLKMLGISIWISVKNINGREYNPHAIFDKYVLIRHDNGGFLNIGTSSEIILKLISNTDALLGQMDILMNCHPKRLSDLEITKYNQEDHGICIHG